VKRRGQNQVTAIDWQQVRQRLARTGAATEEALRLSPERAKAVMDERAKALARVPPAAPQAAEVLEVVTFLLADEHYAVETQYVREVREVVRLSEYTPLPGAPPFLRGVINLRGEILAIIDLRTFFGVPDKALSDLSRVLVLGVERAEFGVLADEAHEVRMLRTDEVLEPPGSVAGVGREYLRGVTQEALIVLDGAALLQDGRLFIDQGEADTQ
jgi:purine-binding chemotaxis protein CheW